MRKCLLLLLIALLAVTRAEANDACQADFDGSGVVDFADFLLFNTLYGQRGGETCAKAVDADSLAMVSTLRDSIVALQAALGATRFAVATLQSTTTELQNALASETERANENQRRLTASNDAFNSLAQTRCQESEPEPEPPQGPEPPGAPAPQPEPPAPAPLPEPPVVIEPPPEPEPPPAPLPEPPVVIEPPPQPEPPPVPRFNIRLQRVDRPHETEASMSIEKKIQADGDGWIVDFKISFNGLSGRVENAGMSPVSISTGYPVEQLKNHVLKRRLKTGPDTWKDFSPRSDYGYFSVEFSPMQIEDVVVEVQFRLSSDHLQRGVGGNIRVYLGDTSRGPEQHFNGIEMFDIFLD